MATLTLNEPKFGRTIIHAPDKKPAYIVNDSNGRPVSANKPWMYLAWHKTSGRFYIAPDEPRRYLGKDLALAIMRFYEHARTQSVTHHLEGMDIVWSNDEAIRKHYGHDVASIVFKTKEQWEEIYRQKFRTLILENPYQAAREFGIPELANLSALPKPAPSLKLASLIDLYKNQPQPPVERWVKQVELHWQEFVRKVDAPTVNEITDDHIRTYREHAFAKKTRIKHKFGAVKTVLNFAMTEGKDQPSLQRVLSLCEMLVPPKRRGKVKKANPISKDDFRKIFQVADLKYQALLLLSLNAALHPSEVAAVTKDEIDLKKKTFVTNRRKTGIVRAAVLWADTVKAIKVYLKQSPHDDEALFLNDDLKKQSPYIAPRVSKRFKHFSKSAKVNGWCFDNIRDGAYTAAISGGLTVDEAKIVAGHKVTGITDDYVVRNPHMVEKACQSIAKHYGYK